MTCVLSEVSWLIQTNKMASKTNSALESNPYPFFPRFHHLKCMFGNVLGHVFFKKKIYVFKLF
jgi:hypothetical protein